MMSTLMNLVGLNSPQDQWKALVDSATGTSHQKTGQPCQDYGKYEIYDRYLIGAVSDGAGSYQYSQYGSRLAVETTLSYLISFLQRYKFPQSEHEARSLFLNVINSVYEKLKTDAYYRGTDVKQYSCTLLAFIASPQSIIAMQLGDGFIVVRSKFTQRYTLLFEPAKGEFNNETVFITASPEIIKRDLQVKVLNNPVSFICASTDGMENLALESKTNQAFHNFFVPLEKHIQEINPDALAQDNYISDLLNDPAVNQKTDDDKTLLICSALQADQYPELQNVQSVFGGSERLPASTRKPPIYQPSQPSQPDRRQGKGYVDPRGTVEILDDRTSAAPNPPQDQRDTLPAAKRSFLAYLWLSCISLFVYFSIAFFSYFIIALHNYPVTLTFIQVIIGFFTLKSKMPILVLVYILGFILILFSIYVMREIASNLLKDKSHRNQFIYTALGVIFLSIILGIMTASTLQNAYPTAACMRPVTETAYANLCHK